MFKVGERVFDIQFGWGFVVKKIFSNIEVRFEEYTGIYNYNSNGSRVHQSSNRTLYHHDYTPTDSLKPTLDSGNNVESNVLSKREKFAGMAMQGILSGDLKELLGDGIGSDNIALFAIQCADALIKALNEK
jgi:hypothetical protein